MGVEISPVPEPWPIYLDKHIVLLQNSLVTNDFGTYNDISAQDLDLKTDYTATYHKLIDTLHLDPNYKDATAELNEINKKTVESGQGHYKAFSDTVEQLKNTEPDRPQWELDIDRAAEETKKKSNQAIDEAAAAAKQVIGQLPEESRQSAVDVFLYGFQAVARFFENVWNQIKAVAEAVYQFILGIWDKIKTAWNTVVEAAKAAWNWIGSIFPQKVQLSNTSSAVHTSPVGHRNHGHTASPADFNHAGGISATSTGGHTRTGHLK